MGYVRTALIPAPMGGFSGGDLSRTRSCNTRQRDHLGNLRDRLAPLAPGILQPHTTLLRSLTRLSCKPPSLLRPSHSLSTHKSLTIIDILIPWRVRIFGRLCSTTPIFFELARRSYKASGRFFLDRVQSKSYDAE